MDGCTEQQQPSRTSSHSPLSLLQWRQQPIAARLGLLQTVLCQEQPLTPYQAMQDYMHATYRTSMTSAQAQLLTLQTQLRTQLYAAYLEQIQDFHPSYRERGRRFCRRMPSTRIGERLLKQMLEDAAPRAIAQVDYKSSCNKAGHTPTGSMFNCQTTSSSLLGGDAAEYEAALALLDSLAAPFLEPFVEGVKQPFTEAVRSFHAEVKGKLVAHAATVGLTSLLLGGFAGGAIGYFCGYKAGRSKK